MSHFFANQSFRGNGFGTAAHKSVYDDVFGGPPKFGMPNLAPRLEDYIEIFAGFHSARGTSIPILDLPVVDDGELRFKVRSSRFDYSEVFGGFNGLDSALSLEDFVRKSDGRDESSDDDAWSPAESECPSGDTDPSAFSDWSQSFINEDTHHPTTEHFDASSSKASEKNNEKIANWPTQVPYSRATPDNACMFEKNHLPQKVEVQKSQAASDLKSSMSFDGGTSESKKAILLPAKIDFRKQERDVGHVEKCGEPVSNQIKPFVTLKDINLKTKPSHLPPPSRPPPIYVGKKGAPLKQHVWTKHDSGCSLGQAGSPPFYDVEIDGSSSMLASATVGDAMEKAQGKIQSANQKVTQSCSKLQPQSYMKMVEGNVNKTFESIGSCKNDIKTCAGERSRTVPFTEERIKVFEIDQEIPDLVEPERCIYFAEISTKGLNGKESGLSDQISHRMAQTFAWRQETDYFEVVGTGIPYEAIKENMDETKFVQDGSDVVKQLIVNETVEQKEEVKDLNAAKETPKSDDKKKKIEVTAERCPNEMRIETVSKSSSQIVFQKVPKVDSKSCESDAYKNDLKEMKMTKNPEEIIKPQNDCDKSEENQTKADMNVPEQNHMQRGTREKPGSAEILGDSQAKKTDVRKPEEDLDLEESIERLCEAFVRAEEINQTERTMDERNMQDVCYEEQKSKKHKELCQSKDDQNMSREIFYLKDNENRPIKLKEDGKTSHKSFLQKENQELDGSPMISGEFDVEESSILTSASTSSTLFEACEHQELSGCSEDAEQIKWDCEDRTVKLDEANHLTLEIESIKSFDGTDDLDNHDGAPLSWELDRSFGMLERTQETIAHGDDQDLRTTLEESEPVKDVGVTDCPVEERLHSVYQDELQVEKYETGTFVVMDSRCVNQHKNDSHEAGIDIGNSSIKLGNEISKRPSQPDHTNVKASEPGQRVQKTSGVEPNIHQGISNLTSHQPSTVSLSNGKVTGASLTGRIGNRGMQMSSSKHLNQNVEEKAKIMNESEIKERLQKEKELENEPLRKIEEEMEREREREKDRMAVDRASLETRDRLYVEARERAERAAVERAAADARQRAMAEARENLEKASLEARERSLADKASTEARLRSERALVERATLEARQRAFEKTMAERVLSEGRERVERSVSDKFFTTSRTHEMRHSSSFSNSETSNPLRYSYSSVQFGNESESPQRCKARMERYRRTAERAAKALEEKNMRDLVAQREQTERNRLAETLDAEVKRWSNGKEGNLRALLSTLQYILGAESGWQPIPLTEVITSAAVKKTYRKATLCVHPDKLQQRGASIQHKYICEKVFDLLKEAWNTFNSEER